MTDFSSRLIEERKRLGLSQTDFGARGGVTKDSQLNYEKGTRKPDSAYLEAVAAHGVDVGYLLTGIRALKEVTEEAADDAGGQKAVYVSPEEAALLDNYKNADESGRAAARRVLDALAEQKKKRAA